MLKSALIVILLAGPAQQEPGGTVQGHVYSEGSATRLRFAQVEVVGPGRPPVQATTDERGRYVLRGVPAGRRLLRATHIDHAPHEVEVFVPAGGELTLDLHLELRPVRLPAVTARPPGLPALRDTVGRGTGGSADLGAATVHALEASPGVSELGLAEAARDVPGQEPMDPTDVLFVRGGAADLKLVLLDGAPVFAPFHIGGLISALDPEVLRSARLYLGGAPARFDGGLSYVMDLETRAPGGHGPRAYAAVDLLSTRGSIEGTVGNHAGFLVGGRAVHGLGTEPFVADQFPYGYGDAIARVDIDLGRIGTLGATGFWNRESVWLDTLNAFEPAAWGNDALSVRYRTTLGDRATLEATAATGRFRTRLPLGGARPLVTDGASDRTRFAVDFEQWRGPLRLQLGTSHETLVASYRAWARGAASDSSLLRATGEGDVSGVYADVLTALSARVVVRAGMRADVFSVAPALRFAPRLSATLLLTDQSSLTLAAGRYRQYVRAPAQSLVYLGTAVPDTVREPPLAIARANHLVLSLDQDLGDGLLLGVEGFFKTFEAVPGSTGDRAETSGVDLWVRRGTGTFTGWLGYSLAWVWSAGTERLRPSQIFAGRHLVNAGVNGPVPGGGAFEVRVGYGAGLPYTAIPEPEAATPVFSTAPGPHAPARAAVAEVPGPPSDPDRPYLRLDGQVSRTWRGEWRGNPFEITPYLKVLNALNRRDALFYHYDRASAAPEPRAIAAIPVLPIFGLEWRF
jgi:hypothetical protein